MGGNILSLYAGICPEKIKHFFNIEGFGPPAWPPETISLRLQKWLKQRKKTSFKIYPTWEKMVKRLHKANPHLSWEQADLLAHHLTKKKGDGFIFRADPKHKWAHPYVIPLEQYQVLWQRITASCLYIAGENSRMGEWFPSEKEFKQEIQDRIKSFPKGAQMVYLKECGHMAHHEKPREIAEMILHFIENSK